MSKWMPIETAPKDGSGFLAFMSKYWIEGMYWNGTDWSYLSDGDCTPHCRYQPTHWMPLPAEPSKDDLWHNTHTCSYSCDRPECIRAQRDELAVRLEAQMDQASGSAEYLAYLEAAVDDAGFVIKHDGGTLGNSNFRLEPKTQPVAEQEAVAWQVGDEFYPSESLAIEAIQQWGPSGAIAIPLYAAASVAAAPVVDARLANWIIAAVGDIPYSMMTSEQVIAALEENRRAYEGNEGCGTHYRASTPAAPGIDREQFRPLINLGMSYGPGSTYRIAAESLADLIDANAERERG